MMRQHNSATMLSLGVRRAGGHAFNTLDAFLTGAFERSRHATRVETIKSFDVSVR
ncbi:RpiB/LacA/LacB family sugar-phosphate isomerase [Neorhizobium galegae]|uniref:RpiB/LacA/LacB family sugar-phosphate isomerase n=1 Tax=Neorhizobium galegae TaxID=399 RepID=UPI00351CD5E2